MGRFEDLNKAVRNHDECLFFQITHGDRMDLYRRSKHGDHPPHYIFSLTEDWTTKTRPVPWCEINILNRLRAHDLWRDDNFVANYIKETLKDEESKDRARRNNTEAFLRDFRRQFAKATDSINTSTLSKT